MFLTWLGVTKDKGYKMIAGRLFKKNITRVVLLVGLLYLIYTLCFFGSLNEDQKNTAARREVKREKVIDPPADQLWQESEYKSPSVVDIVEKRKQAVENRKQNAEREALVEPPRPKSTEPLYEKIDPDKEHKRRRLNVLKEIYAIPYVENSVYKLNESLSRMIELDRPPPDLRPFRCQELTYDLDSLPTISVIFPIYNEALSMVLRTVHSVINNTPAKLLKDVILVDDNSKYENLREPLDRYIAMLPSKVKVLRNSERQGLIRARMRGAEIAKGDVLLFQDSHTEFGPNWVEPALKYLQLHPNTIVQPLVQELGASTISWPKRDQIRYEQMWRGVFMWDMRFAWNLAPESYTAWRLQDYDPFPNPVLVGCSMLIRKDFFNKIGGFDEGLDIWGGENIELSLRTWMCGGKMIIHPCSQVAHVFKPFSYSFDGDKEKIVASNSIRVVESWMDDHRPFFYASNYIYDYKRVELSDEKKDSLRKHKALRDRLNCKSFDWYLKNVLPEMNVPTKDMTMFGEIQNLASSLCWKADYDGYIVMTSDCYTYSRMKPDAEFGLTNGGRLMFGDKCVSIDKTHLLRAVHCGEPDYRHRGWSFAVLSDHGLTAGTLHFTIDDVKYCVQQITNILPIHKNEQLPQLAECDPKGNWQTWVFSYNFAFDLVPTAPV